MFPDPAGIVTRDTLKLTVYPDLGRKGEMRNGGRSAGCARVRDGAAGVDDGPREERRRRGVLRHPGGACSAPGGEAICSGVTHRLGWCGGERGPYWP